MDATTRALGRATLARQLLLDRSETSSADAVAHLLGLQAQNVKPPYFQLWSRLRGFEPESLSALMESRRVVRMVTMRSTIHTHTAEDALTLRPLVQPARDRELTNFRKGLDGVDLDRLTEISRAFVEAEPRTMQEIRTELLTHWPDADPPALSVAARCRLPLVQVTPRGLWGRSGQVRLTTLRSWLGRDDDSALPDPADPAARADLLDRTVLRYLGAFGPASVQDMQTWAGLTRLREAFERLRPRLVVLRDERGTELFDLPDAPRPDPDVPAPPRFLPEFDNLLLSHADRTRIVPADLKGRSFQGNQAYCTLLVDGVLGGLWRLDTAKGPAGKPARSAPAGAGGEIGGTATLTVELFGRVPKALKEEIAAEGERLLAGMTTAAARSLRFGPISG
ncbi:winged helix DNA-binding domain-containing protein [Streptomyces sp. NPDC093225]|uniref:winged helix DNA-binding domain-containing protein n=1 Tax=Streptomyces sp. NPDC093225 TaxID=3366034 RepID=UPI0038135100